MDSARPLHASRSVILFVVFQCALNSCDLNVCGAFVNKSRSVLVLHNVGTTITITTQWHPFSVREIVVFYIIMLNFSIDYFIAAYRHIGRNLRSSPARKPAFANCCVRMRNAVNEFKGEIIQIVDYVADAAIRIIFDGDAVAFTPIHLNIGIFLLKLKDRIEFQAGVRYLTKGIRVVGNA